MTNRAELESILNYQIPDIEGKNIWIWGTGDTAWLYQEGFARLENEGFIIQGYIDNDILKVGGTFFGKPVISPEEVHKIDNPCVMLCSINSDVVREVTAQLSTMQVEWHLIDEVILKSHADSVMQVYDALSDECSKETYADIVKSRITGKEMEPRKLEEDYFILPPFAQQNPEEVFVDCGAWRGDTVERYVAHKKGIFRKIYAFEPDEINFMALKNTVDRIMSQYDLAEESFMLCPYGVGETTKEGYFERYEKNNGQGSKYQMLLKASEKGGHISKIIALDEFLTEPYSFLKADIESFEYQMLCGAAQGIRRYKPLLALCIYHNVVDLYSIPLLVKECVPGYHLAIRHHAKDLSGTVLYAWV